MIVIIDMLLLIIFIIIYNYKYKKEFFRLSYSEIFLIEKILQNIVCFTLINLIIFTPLYFDIDKSRKPE